MKKDRIEIFIIMADEMTLSYVANYFRIGFFDLKTVPLSMVNVKNMKLLIILILLQHLNYSKLYKSVRSKEILH